MNFGKTKKALGTMYKQREIVLVPFPYSDLSTTKRRPVLIMSNDNYNNQFEDVLVCVIITNLYKDAYSVDLANNDLEISVLPESSVVKAHKLFTIHQSKILKKFSVVKSDYFKKVTEKLQELIAIL